MNSCLQNRTKPTQNNTPKPILSALWKHHLKPGVVAHTFESQHSGGTGRGVSELEASLVYRASSGTARVTQRNLASKAKPNKNKEPLHFSREGLSRDFSQ